MKKTDLSTKKTSGKRRRQKRQLAILTVIILIASIAAIVLLTPGFNIKKINVTGNSVIKESEIIQRSGIEKGVNIFDVSLKKAKDNILSIGYIESVKIKRKFPSTIEINVVEEVGVAYIRAEEGYVIITADGRCIDITDGVVEKNDSEKATVQLPDLPIITGLDEVKYKVGEVITSENSAQLEALFECLHELAGQEYIFNVKEINMSNPDNIEFYYMTRNLCVSLGDTDALDYKIESFGSVLADLGPNPKGYIDLSRVDTLGQATHRENMEVPEKETKNEPENESEE